MRPVRPVSPRQVRFPGGGGAVAGRRAYRCGRFRGRTGRAPYARRTCPRARPSVVPRGPPADGPGGPRRLPGGPDRPLRGPGRACASWHGHQRMAERRRTAREGIRMPSRTHRCPRGWRQRFPRPAGSSTAGRSTGSSESPTCRCGQGARTGARRHGTGARESGTPRGGGGRSAARADGPSPTGRSGALSRHPECSLLTLGTRPTTLGAVGGLIVRAAFRARPRQGVPPPP